MVLYDGFVNNLQRPFGLGEFDGVVNLRAVKTFILVSHCVFGVYQCQPYVLVLG
jgi:hypothetical protein